MGILLSVPNGRLKYIRSLSLLPKEKKKNFKISYLSEQIIEKVVNSKSGVVRSIDCNRHFKIFLQLKNISKYKETLILNFKKRSYKMS